MAFWRFGEKQIGERGEWENGEIKSPCTGKFFRLWWCWKGNVLDRQSMPLVKFFHCVSVLNQMLPHSFSFFFRYSFFLPFLLPYSLSSPFLRCLISTFFFLKLPLLLLSFIWNYPNLPVICKFSSIFYASFSHYSSFAPIYPLLFSSIFSPCFYVAGVLFSCMQTTLKSPPISDQAPGPH